MGTDSNTLLGDIQGQKYPGYGVCIYCGSDGGADGLRDEHIIPLALNGNAIIKGASCTTCEKKINPADTHLAKDVFWNYRLLTGAKTRNPQDRPDVLMATFEIGDKKISHDLPIQKFPFSTALPIWGNAGFFRSAPIDAPFPKTVSHVYHWMPPNIREVIRIADDEDLMVRSTFRSNPELFARAIAKIAYCHTVIRFGLNGFRRLALPHVILGTCPAAAYFVGVPLTNPPPPLSNKILHTVQHVDLVSGDKTLKLYLVKVRLFAYNSYKEFGMPVYHVITGAPKSS